MKLVVLAAAVMTAFVALMMLLAGELLWLLLFGLASVVFAGACVGDAKAVYRARLIIGALLVVIIGSLVLGGC